MDMTSVKNPQKKNPKTQLLEVRILKICHDSLSVFDVSGWNSLFKISHNTPIKYHYIIESHKKNNIKSHN